MSAQLDLPQPHYRPMDVADLDHVMAIERRIYPYPWTRGNFEDSLAAAYECWIAEHRGAIVGYSVLSAAAGEAHLLNLSIAAAWQRCGFGSALLRFMVQRAREAAAYKVFLEVRPSNAAARGLYGHAGFREIGRRRGYYPAREGHEDALVLELSVGSESDE